jgi:hypothetical protein
MPLKSYAFLKNEHHDPSARIVHILPTWRNSVPSGREGSAFGVMVFLLG